jgi:hypothetical protein
MPPTSRSRASGGRMNSEKRADFLQQQFAAGRDKRSGH